MASSSIAVETERLLLRRWRADDWRGLTRLTANPAVMRYIGGGTPWSDERTKQFVARQIALADELGFCLWALQEKENGALIGQTGIAPLGETGEIEIGWWLAEDRWGRGLATEAARGALAYGFEEAGLERIVSIAHPDNRASWHVMEKIGMRFERRTTAAELGLAHGDIPVVYYSASRDRWARRS